MMEMSGGKQYLRMECVVYIELKEGEKPEQAEDRLLELLPDGMDIASYRSSMWIPDEE